MRNTTLLPRQRRLCTAVAVGLALAAAGCGHPASRPGGPSTSDRSPTASATSASPRAIAERQALAAYTGMWMTMAYDAETSDPDDPRLRDYAAGKALALVITSLAADKETGVISRGRPVLRPRVVSLTPDAAPVEAAIDDCGDSTNWTKAKADGSAYQDTPGGKRKITATVRSMDGTWKVTDTMVGAVGSCA